MAWAIGASQPGEWAIGASQPDVAGVTPSGQVITIIMTKAESIKRDYFLASMLPLFWLKQGKAKRRDFIKNTILTMLGMR